MYKLISRVIINRLAQKTGLRKGFSAVDHGGQPASLPRICGLWEGFRHHWDVGWLGTFAEMPGQLPIYTSAEMSARSRNNDRPRSRIEHKTNSIRKGDTYSPSLFINAMEYVLKTLDWNGRGIDFNGQYISHLRVGFRMNISKNNIMPLISRHYLRGCAIIRLSWPSYPTRPAQLWSGGR